MSSAHDASAFLRFQVVHLDVDRPEVVIAIAVKENIDGNLVQKKQTFYRRFGDWFDCHIRPGRVIDLMLQDSESSPPRAYCTLLLAAISKNCDVDGSVATVPIVLQPAGKLTLQVKYFQGHQSTSPSVKSDTERGSSSSEPPKKNKIIRRNAQKLPKVHLVGGHHFVAKFFNQPAFCSFCNDFLWGFNKQGYSCTLCNNTVHKRCHDKVIDVCTKNSAQHTDLINTYGQRMGFAVPHVFKSKNFFKPTFCRHCGQMLWGLFNQGQECVKCGAVVHHKCRDVAANTCGVDPKKLVDILHKIRLDRQPSTSSTRPLSTPNFDTMSMMGEDEELSKPVYEDPSQFLEPAVRQQTKKWTLNDFDIVRLLGKGSFGKVFLANRKGDKKEFYAVKSMRIDFVLNSNDFETTRVERKVLQLTTKSRAPFLLHMLCTFKTESHLFYVLDFLPGGDLMFHLQQCERFDLNRTRFYAAEIVCALQFLHQKKVIYRDLKLDNVLLDREGHICLADFGMCRDEVTNSNKASTFCGTLDYIAPEIIESKSYTFSVDWWSFGVLVYEMITGQTPFYGDTETELFEEIKNPSLPDMGLVPDLGCSHMLQQLFQRDPLRRLGCPTCPEVAFLASSSESSVHSASAAANPFWPAAFEGSSVSPRHAIRHQASTSSGECLEPVSPGVDASGGGPSPSASASWPQQIDANELVQLDIIGSGGCGLVFRGRWGNKHVAIKQINQGSMASGGAGPDGCSYAMSTEAWLQRFYNEAQTIWMARDHPNVVQLLGVCLQRYWLVFEFCAGGGLDFVIARCRLAPAVIIEWAVQIASGMEWLHSVGIIHRDLKSCNILLKYPLPQLAMADAISEHESWPNDEEDINLQLQQPVILKIADFGLARQLALDKSRVTAKYAEGTVRYLAPEVITSRTYSKASDVWSYGVVFWELLTGEQPYRDVEECAVMFRIGRQRRSLLPVPPSCPPAFASLLNDCWSSDPFNRPSFAAIIDRLSLSDLRVAEFTRTGTEFSSLQDSWRQIIENSFNELRVRQEELELADLALRERAAQQLIIDNRLRQWERQLAQRELRVVERELRTLFMDDQHWGPGDRRRRRASSDAHSTSHFSLSSFLSPRPSRLRPPHRVSLSHLRRDRTLISRPIVSTMHVSHVVAPAVDSASPHGLPVIVTTGVDISESTMPTPNSVFRHNHNQLALPLPHTPPPSRSWISVPDIRSAPTSPVKTARKEPSRVKQALTGASRLLAAVLVGYDLAGPRPPAIPSISAENTSQESSAIYDSQSLGDRLIDYGSDTRSNSISVPRMYPSNVLPLPTIGNGIYQSTNRADHLFYIGDAYSKSLLTGNNSPMTDIRRKVSSPDNFISFEVDVPQQQPTGSTQETNHNRSRPVWLQFSNAPETNNVGSIGAGNTSASGSTSAAAKTAPAQSTDSGMALSSLSLGSVSGASGSQTSATTPLDTSAALAAPQPYSLISSTGNAISDASAFIHGASNGSVNTASRYRQRASIPSETDDIRTGKANNKYSPGATRDGSNDASAPLSKPLTPNGAA